MNLGDLTRQQLRILRYIVEGVRQRGRAPTHKEICAKFGFRSPNAAVDHLKALEKKGYIERRGAPLGLRVIWDKVWQRLGIPIVNRVPAGVPQLDDAEVVRTLTPDDVFRYEEGVVAVRVVGDSMKDAGILPGDVLVVRSQPVAEYGDIVVARTDDEGALTVKRLVKIDGKPYLKPENRDVAYEKIPLNGGEVLGKVLDLHRHF